MKAYDYVNEINLSLWEIKEARTINVLTVTEANIAWTARTNVIKNLALRDSEINSDDFSLICNAVFNCTLQISNYISHSRTDEP